MRLILLQRCSTGMRASPQQGSDPSRVELSVRSQPTRALGLGGAGAAADPTAHPAWRTTFAAAKLAGNPIG